MIQSLSILGDIVREERKNKNLSQEALAEKIGICKRTIIDIEKGTGNPKFEILYMLVRELNLPLYQIFYPEFYPEKLKHVEMKEVVMKELYDCTECELKIILSVIKSLRDALKQDFSVKNV